MTGKFFTRYYRDVEFRAAVDHQFELADAATEPGTWITYAVHDANRTDTLGCEAEGPIIYVGQTKEFAKRVRKRMRNAGTAVRRPTDRIDGACYDIMAQGKPPAFTVRARTFSAIESLISETNTAKALIARGYQLLNQWAEQRVGGLDLDRYSVPHNWLWPITTDDAIGSGIDVIVRDMATGQEIVLDLATFPPGTRLSKIRAHMKEAGCQPRLHIR